MVTRRSALTGLGLAVGLGLVGALAPRFAAFSPRRRVVLFGDSMMEFNAIPELIAQATGAEILACAVGGTTLAANYQQYYDTFSLTEIAKALTGNDWAPMDDAASELKSKGDDNSEILAEIKNTALVGADVAVIWIGTNDFMQATPMGAEDSMDMGSFNGAINLTVERLRQWRPALDILFLTPVFRARQMLGDGKNSDDFPNKDGLLLSAYADAILAAGPRLGVRTLDLLRLSGFGMTNSDKMYADGVHLSADGQAHAAALIAAAL